MRGSRLDDRVVSEGMADTRTRAQALIRAGRILVDDVPVDKPGTPIRDGAVLRLRGSLRRFVSRGGDKLVGALADLGVDPHQKTCLDLGASTGGFTDCLLQAGARCVVAVDVGYGQLDARLRGDPRVSVIERTNARNLDPALLLDPIELVTIDVSFISLRLILPRVSQVAPQAEVLALVKPQFEVGRQHVGKGGVVRDDALRASAVRAVRECATRIGYRVRGEVDSRVHGPKGNREIFLRLVPVQPMPRGSP